MRKSILGWVFDKKVVTGPNRGFLSITSKKTLHSNDIDIDIAPSH